MSHHSPIARHISLQCPRFWLQGSTARGANRGWRCSLYASEPTTLNCVRKHLSGWPCFVGFIRPASDTAACGHCKVAYPDWLLISAPLVSFGRTFGLDDITRSETRNHLRQLCAASNVRFVYNDMISNEGVTEKKGLEAVVAECKVGGYEAYCTKGSKNSWTFWF